jgi:hypothetical protein
VPVQTVVALQPACHIASGLHVHRFQRPAAVHLAAAEFLEFNDGPVLAAKRSHMSQLLMQLSGPPTGDQLLQVQLVPRRQDRAQVQATCACWTSAQTL